MARKESPPPVSDWTVLYVRVPSRTHAELRKMAERSQVPLTVLAAAIVADALGHDTPNRAAARKALREWRKS